MANLQKIYNGKRKYGITPHIPGGFVTAEQLIRIGEVAKKYNGVLKITSGQRILITNLELEDIDQIWEELKMKPAVIVQNSVKNVEICPASFCKRSKVNSTPLGMRLSKKYQFMEMPCRTKIGVAGCRNACGGVYSKDVGVIGDNGGYRVCVGGSAGFNPRMADIVAEDISEKEASHLVDCIFEYYLREAEPGEKLGHFIDRVNFDKFKKEVLSLQNK